ncbi:hypothetical protein ACLB2K_041069 [Fragaria x ananassa]
MSCLKSSNTGKAILTRMVDLNILASLCYVATHLIGVGVGYKLQRKLWTSILPLATTDLHAEVIRGFMTSFQCESPD